MIKFDFTNKTVFITAASKGIGLELAKNFAINNAKVAICSRSIKNLIIAKKEILSFKKDAKIYIIKHDLTKNKNLNVVLKKIENYFKSNIDILINNSGGPSPKIILKTNKRDWDNSLNSILKSAIFFSTLVSKNMIKQKWGRIINLTSSTAKEPAEGMCLSNVSRAALVSFSKTLSLEIAKNNITVNSILTGGVLTNRLKELIAVKNKQKFKSIINKIENLIPVGHIAKPVEFIQLILFLCTDNASYINGASIEIDGGSSKSIF